MTEDILVAGETLIDFLPGRPGPLADVSGFDRRPGGAPANVAVALAKLERPPLFWTRVGTDPFGRYLEGVLESHDLPDRFLERDPDAKTTLAFVTHDAAGDRAFTFYRDDTADTRMEPGRVPDETLADLEWVHAGGVALSSGRSREATLDLLARAAAADCTVSFDPNARAELWPDEETFRTVCREALAHVDVWKATVEELEALGFGDGEVRPEEIARDALAFSDGKGDGSECGGEGPHTVLVTRGGDGAVAVASERAPWNATGESPAIVDHRGYPAEVVDTTGAGDAFLAGSIAALFEGRPLESSLAFANAVAATATTAAGAMAALPTREAVDSMLEGR
ncbi:carbohydrate kinase family protein [Natrarchaeobaculum aegyptiacum]|uniref:Carbohydrate kinase n=1 Tax=Natrarchaeobaculum aegyptiacum TaxID=745377 RepID=A0A2Z2HQQ9_9EURY|nr:carbohydrate kinase [Natrarchaeobaculum aegyptiacum]ARS88335.1 carbohydrate kinase [Natrarchaeobaculum aegyptiacum]